VCTLGSAAPLLVGVAVAISAGGFVVGETKCLDFMGEGVSKWVGLGMAVCGTVLSCGAGAGASVGGSGGTAVDVLQNGATVASGCQAVDTAVHQHRADGHQIEAKAAQHQMQRIQDAVEEIISELQDGKEASGRRSEAVNKIVETEGQTLTIAAGGQGS
jgi:hypothetical protein